MSNSSDGDEMEWMMSRSVRLKRDLRGKSWSEHSETGEGSNKKLRASQSEKQKPENTEKVQGNDWKVIIEFNQDGGHYHPIKLTKAIEKEIRKIKLARFLNNK